MNPLDHTPDDRVVDALVSAQNARLSLRPYAEPGGKCRTCMHIWDRTLTPQPIRRNEGRWFCAAAGNMQYIFYGKGLCKHYEQSEHPEPWTNDRVE